MGGKVISSGKLLLLLLATFLVAVSLGANVPWFWLDRPNGRFNPHDPKSNNYVPFNGTVATATPLAGASPTPSIVTSATATPTITENSTDSPTPTITATISASSTESATYTISPTESPTLSQ